MAVPGPPRVPETRIAGYRFAGVALDLRRGSLSIDGVEVATPPLLLQLLQILCESDGRLLTRRNCSMRSTAPRWTARAARRR